MTGRIILETDRLILREQTEDDAAFILELLNDAAFLQYIGDKGVRTLDDARAYIRDGQIASYNANGFGLYHVALRDSGEPIGICGLVLRPTLQAPDIGYAFLPAFRSKGYAKEAARAVLDYARNDLGFSEVLAIVSVDNEHSQNLLKGIGLSKNGLIRMREDGDEVALYSTQDASVQDASVQDAPVQGSPVQGSTTARS